MAGSGGLAEAAALYYTPAVLYTCLTVVVFMPLFWARLMGRPFIALTLTTLLAAVSILFAVLYIFVLDLPLEFLAIAQAAATALALVISLTLLHSGKNRLKVFIPRHIKADIYTLAALGSPPGLSRLYRFISLFLLNLILLNVGGTEAIAIFGVLSMLLRFITAFASGISGVQMPVAGVLKEERDTKSLRQLARVMFAYGNGIALAAAVCMLVFYRGIAAIFGVESGVLFFPLVCFCLYTLFFMNGNLFVSWYTAVQRVKLANIITLAQDMVLPPLFALLFALIGGNAIWLHQPVAGIVLAVIVPLLLLFARKSDKDISFPMLLDKKLAENALAFSVERDAVKGSEASAFVNDFCDGQGIPMKQGMKLSMAVEELVAITAEQSPEGGSISIRLTRFEGGTILRLRDTGRKFNAIEYYQSKFKEDNDMEDVIDYMGLKYIVESAEVIYYRETFGINNLVVII
jgi:O-antigen/teichoic acid export membrane protein